MAPSESSKPEEFPSLHQVAPRITWQPAIRLHWWQCAIVCLMAALPILTFVGLLGGRAGHREARNETLTMAVHYPETLRYGERGAIRVTIVNTGQQPVHDLSIAFGSQFVLAFSGLSSWPAMAEGFSVPVGSLPPGASQIVLLEFEGEHWGRQEGLVSVRSGDQPELDLRIATLVYP